MIALASPLISAAAAVGAIVALVAAVYAQGRADGRAAALVDQAQQAQAVANKQERETEKVRIAYRDRVKVVREKGEEVIREVEKLVPVDGCQLDGGFRVLHDAAARGELPDTATGADGPPAPVEQAAAARTVAGNYGACHENTEQLTALQDWVRRQRHLTKGD